MFALPLPARLSKLKSRAPECHLNRSAHGLITVIFTRTLAVHTRQEMSCSGVCLPALCY